MSFKFKDIADLILPIGALFLGWKVVNQLFPPVIPYDPNIPCAKGIKYSRSLFEPCADGYTSEFWGLECTCVTPPGGPPGGPPVTPPVTPPGCSWLDYLNPLSPCFILLPPGLEIPPVPPPVTPPVTPPITEIPCTCEEKANWFSYWNPLSPCFLHDVADTGPCNITPPAPPPVTPPWIAPPGACPLEMGVDPVPGCVPRYSCTDPNYAYGYDRDARVYSCMPGPVGIERGLYIDCLADGDMPAKSRGTWGCMRL